MAGARSKVWVAVRRVALLVALLAGVALGYWALQKIGFGNIASALISSSPTFVVLGLATMCLAMVFRGFSWHAILKAALPRARIKLSDAMQGTMIGVLMSSTLPARLGEPSRALVVARRTGRPRENLPVVLGTIVSQTLLNILALIILGAIMFSSVDIFSGHQNALLVAAIAPAVLLLVVLAMPMVLRTGPGQAGSRWSRVYALVVRIRGAMTRVRAGLTVFSHLRLGAIATVMQLAAWAMQALSCYLLLIALGLEPPGRFRRRRGRPVRGQHHRGAAGDAGEPRRLPGGDAPRSCTRAGTSAWANGVAYGVILQAVEVATAILLGMPALVKEGMSWREVRLRAMHATPVKLPARPSRRGGAAGKRAAEPVEVES